MDRVRGCSVLEWMNEPLGCSVLAHSDLQPLTVPSGSKETYQQLEFVSPEILKLPFMKDTMLTRGWWNAKVTRLWVRTRLIKKEAKGFCVAKNLWTPSSSATRRPSVDHKMLEKIEVKCYFGSPRAVTCSYRHRHTCIYGYIAKLEKRIEIISWLPMELNPAVS